jgi:hypothetical protein
VLILSLSLTPLVLLTQHQRYGAHPQWPLDVHQTAQSDVEDDEEEEAYTQPPQDVGSDELRTNKDERAIHPHSIGEVRTEVVGWRSGTVAWDEGSGRGGLEGEGEEGDDGDGDDEWEESGEEARHDDGREKRGRMRRLK